MRSKIGTYVCGVLVTMGLLACGWSLAQAPTFKPLSETATITVTAQDIVIFCAADRISQRPANGPGYAPGTSMIVIDISPRLPKK